MRADDQRPSLGEAFSTHEDPLPEYKEREAATQHRKISCHAVRQGGFTLIEVLVTMVLMGIVIPVAMRGVTVALNAASTAKRSSEAAHLAQQKMDELLSLGDPNQFTGQGDFGAEWTGYHWKADTTTSDDNMATLTIDVTYSVSGRPRDVQVTTLVSLDYLDVTAGTSGTSGGTGLTGGTP